RNVADRRDVVAKRASDANRLGSKMDGDAARLARAVDAEMGETRDRREAVVHRIRRDLRPALAPQVARHLAAVHCAQHRGHRPRARRDAPVDLADAEDRVASAARLIVTYGMARANER